MARTRKICGFETGRSDADYSLVGGPTIQTVSPRTGLYSLKDKKTVAGVAGCAIIPSSVTIADGALFRIAFRFFFKVTTFPSSSNYVLGEFTSLSCRLEMSSGGLLRMNSALESPPAYAGQTIAGHWYEARCLLIGFNKAAAVTNSARTQYSVDVYDWGIDGDGDGLDPTLLVSFATSVQTTVNQVNINCTGGFFNVVGDALQEMKGKCDNYHLTVTGAAPNPCSQSGNGEYSVFSSQTNATGPDGHTCTDTCGASTNGAVIEVGGLNGLSIQLFKKGNTAIGANPDFTIGQSASTGISCTREIDYDDVWIEIAYGVDVPFAFAGNFPLSTHVRPFPVTAQGFYDLFSPASAFARVQAIPMVDTQTITASLLNAATSYLHDVLDIFDIVENIRVYARLNGTAAAQSLIVFEDPSILTSLAITVPAANGFVYGDVPLENEDAILGEDFNLIEYGMLLDNASLVNLHSIFIEVLTGEADIVLIDGPGDGGGQIEGGLNLGDLGITNGALVLITDGSGLYSLTQGQFFDILYARNAGEATVDVQIPDPFWESSFFGG